MRAAPELAQVAGRAGRHALSVMGAFHPGPGDGTPEGCRTLVLLGPDEPRFWPHFRAGPEAGDGEPDPLDRWSRRVIGALAADLGAVALFPFGGPPWQPFTDWALRSGRVWNSPVHLLVHDVAGLFFSCRGALAMAERLTLPPPGARPCADCAAPCLDACPPGALTAQAYDVPACHAYLDSTPGQACLTRGCAVRRACPVGRGRRPEAQSAYHMARFHGTSRPCDG